ncbi:MAG: HAMP domain-containing sensor histidine kinase [Oscillospiraceae bacterium]|nr:HAMP domain-containing sensor histidine kinase [Oscillospiraceae bacterium]
MEAAQGRKKNLRGGITRRWIVVNLLTTVVILLVASVAILISVRNNYNQTAQQILQYKAKYLMNTLPSATTASSSERADAAVGLAEKFEEKDKYELMLIDSTGKVVVTSSGFAWGADEPLEDYQLAIASEDGQGSYFGYTTNNEHIVAVTQVITSGYAGDIVALRLVSSLAGVDAQLAVTANLVFAVCVVILLFMIFSGLYFVRSIVLPIRSIGASARRIAGGDYEARVENKYGDEIGELCDIVNDMAVGLSKTDKMKNEFISSISHELRTPLTSIKGWGETLVAIGTKDEENFRKGMQIILSETDRLSCLVEDLLDFSRLQTGRIELNTGLIDLRRELTESVATIEQRAARAGIAFRTELPDGPVVITADRNRLRQVFANIFDNAVKYSNPGGAVTVALTLGASACVTVSDTGAGIPPQELAHVTERFYKASNSVTGSGIGLAVVKEIMQLHGGSLDIASERGKGTTVPLRFPLRKQ